MNDVNFKHLNRAFTVLADNEQWLPDNHEKTVQGPELEQTDGAALAKEEHQILRCLGAALILQWNTLPQKLRRELFDNAGTMGELWATAELRGRIARFCTSTRMTTEQSHDHNSSAQELSEPACCGNRTVG